MRIDKWIRVSLLNLFIVGFIGVILRYKIAFSLPFVDQKFLLDGHSHFAFAGWVSQILMVLIVQYLFEHIEVFNLKRYHILLWGNMLTAYGMLFSFPFEGYAFVSICFSTSSVLVSYFFIAFSWKDLNRIKAKTTSAMWLKASLFLYGFSSLGAFTLAWLMANKIAVQDYYFAAVYFFLHFQYNGWFLFGCFGLLFHYLDKMEVDIAGSYNKKLFLILFTSCFPAWLLSLLWMQVPVPLYFTALASAMLQLSALFYLVQIYNSYKKKLKGVLTKITKWLWFMAMISFCLKIILQSMSTIPALSQYAFGFRPLVIGYLHLSFLCITSFFIIGYINQYLFNQKRQLSPVGVVLFVSGVIITETILMLQGFAAISFNYIPYTNVILFITALIIATGLLFIVIKNNSYIQPGTGYYIPGDHKQQHT